MKKLITSIPGITIIVSLLVLFGIQIFSPNLYNYIELNWPAILSQNIEQIKTEINEEFRLKEDSLINVRKKLEQVIINSNGNQFFEDFYKISTGENQGFLVMRNLEEFIWSSNFSYPSEKFNHLSPGSFFIDTHFALLLVNSSKISSSGNNYSVFSFLVFEPKMRNPADAEKNTGFLKYIENKYQTGFRIYYNQSEEILTDGREAGFFLVDSKSQKTAYLIMEKPYKSTTLNNINDWLKYINAFFVLLILAALGIISKKHLNTAGKLLKFGSYLVFAAMLRVFLYYFNTGSLFGIFGLNQSAYFSSSFMWGLVSSPIEFTFTAILFLLIIVKFYKYAFECEIKVNSIFLRVIILIAFTAISLILLRGFGAAVKSIVFDSTLHYFKGNDLFPSVTIVIMVFNLLMLAVCSFAVTLVLFKHIFYLGKGLLTVKLNAVYIFVIIQVCAFVYDVMQKEPQGTPLIRILYITLAFWFVYSEVKTKKSKIFTYFYMVICSSALSILLLLHYNSSRESDSLKTIAMETLKDDENKMEFVLREAALHIMKTLTESTHSELRDEISGYKVWNSIPLRNEGIEFEVEVLDKRNSLIGQYGNFPIPVNRIMANTPIRQSVFPEIAKTEYGKSKVFHTSIKWSFEDSINYIIAVKAILRKASGYDAGQSYLKPKLKEYIPLDEDKLSIIEFNDGKLSGSFGEIIPKAEELNKISNAKLGIFQDTFKQIKLTDRDYLFYIAQTESMGKLKRVAVGLREKEVTLELFDFFKIFFIHFLICVLFASAAYLFHYRQKLELVLTFRYKLLLAFLVISIIPLVLLAVYLRSLTEIRNDDAIKKSLRQKAFKVISVLEESESKEENGLKEKFISAAGKTDVNFNVFNGYKMIPGIGRNYIPGRQNLLIPDVYLNIFGEGYVEYMIKDGLKYEYYIRYNSNGSSFVLSLDSENNQVYIPLKGSEFDVFLFAIYSIASIIIIIISSVLASQISEPISELTSAAKRLARGDSSIQIRKSYHGEIGDLVNGFNQMVKELRKNQVKIAEIERESAWKEMARQVAHEIKNPLTPMKLSVQQLIAAYNDKSPKFDMIFEKVTNTVITQIDVLKNIASEFSNFARMPHLKPEKVDIIFVLSEAAELFREDNAKIVLNLPDSPVFVWADRDQMGRTLINLIRNSIQAGASKIEAEIQADLDECKVILSDNGEGIKKDIIKKIFDADFTTKQDGMGIGLNMAKKFIESIDGRITVESGEKTVFSIILPRMK